MRETLRGHGISSIFTHVEQGGDDSSHVEQNFTHVEQVPGSFARDPARVTDNRYFVARKQSASRAGKPRCDLSRVHLAARLGGAGSQSGDTGGARSAATCSLQCSSEALEAEERSR